MKRISKFNELCALPIWSFVKITTKKCEDYIVVVCPPNIVERTAAEERSSHCNWFRLPVGSLAVVYWLQESICFRAETASLCYLNDSMVRGEFESDGCRYEFYLLEPEEVCTLFLQTQSLRQGANEVIKCLKDNVAKLEKRLT
ncbi:MAG: hypothetical protein AAB575_03080 [Patescibacteria group bacterium]